MPVPWSGFRISCGARILQNILRSAFAFSVKSLHEEPNWIPIDRSLAKIDPI
jgi:hypothetical protein